MMIRLLLLSLVALQVGCSNECDTARETAAGLWEKAAAEQAWCAEFGCDQMVAVYGDNPGRAETVFMELIMGHRGVADALRRDNAEQLEQAYPGLSEARASSMQAQAACN